MKSLALAHPFLAASTCLCVAGGPTAVAPDPMPEVAPTVALHDWSGPYIGLSYGTTSAEIDSDTGGFFDFEDGTLAGVYAGYLMQRGSFVYGGELSCGAIRKTFVPGFPTEDNEFTSVIDLKGRAGYAAHRVLFYGVLGYSMAVYEEPPTRDFDLDGVVYGLGAEYAVSHRVTMGLEYLSRDLSGDASDNALVMEVSTLDTLSLRVGFSF